MHRTDTVARLGLALLVGLLVFASLTFVSASTNEADVEDFTFSLPSRMVGDRVTYQIESVSFRGPQITYEQLPLQQLTLPNGSQVLADPVRVELAYEQSEYDYLLYRDPVSGEGIAGASGLGFGTRWNNNVVLTSSSSISQTQYEFGQGSAECGIWSPAGEAERLPVSVVNLPGCLSESLVLSFVPLEPMDGFSAGMYEGTEDGITTQIVYREDIPYPLRIEFSDSTGQARWYDLQSFSPGLRNLVEVALDAPVQPFMTEQVPASDQLGPDLSSVELDLSLEDAIVALQESNDEQLRTFFAQNPEWRLFQAKYQSQPGEDLWTVELVGKSNALWATVEARDEVEHAGIELVPDGFQEMTRIIRTFGWVSELSPWQDVSSTVPVAPKISEVVDQSNRMQSSGPKVNFIHVSLAPQEDGPHTWRIAAAALEEQTTGSPPERETVYEGTALWFGFDGSQMGWIELSFQSDQEFGEGEGILYPYTPTGPTTAAQANAMGSDFSSNFILASIAAGSVLLVWPAIRFVVALLWARPLTQNHPRRRAIVRRIAEKGPATYEQIREDLQISRGVLTFHLSKLETAGQLRRQTSLGRDWYILPSRPPTPESLIRGTPRRILQHITDSPGVSLQELCQRTGLVPSTVSYHLSRMEDQGVLRRVRVGRETTVFPA